MKKFFLLAAAAIVTLAACSKVETIDSTPETAIRFSVVNHLLQTKAQTLPYTGLTYPTSVPFGTHAWWTASDWTGIAADQTYVFMNNETFEQVNIPADQITGVKYMKEGQNVEVVTDASTETILYAELPAKVHLQVVWTEPGLKGDTATNTLKPAKVESGAEVRVPLFINEGETIEIDTRDGSYLGRVKA